MARGGQTLHRVDLYAFLLHGELPYLQLQGGDAIVVGPVGPPIAVGGAVSNAYRFEFPAARVAASQALAPARPQPGATHMQVVRRTGAEKRDFYLALAGAAGFEPMAGDEILILPKLNPKSLQLLKDVTRILCQIAISAAVVLAL